MEGARGRELCDARDRVLRVQRREHHRREPAARDVARDRPPDDRHEITQADEIPATRFTPQGIAGFDTVNPSSRWAPESADTEQAKQLMDQVQSTKTSVNVFHNHAPGQRDVAVAVQDMWKDVGISSSIKAQAWGQYLEFLGPPPNTAVDVFPARLDLRLSGCDERARALDLRVRQQPTTPPTGATRSSTASSRRPGRRLTTRSASTSTRRRSRSCSARTATYRSHRSTTTRARISST